jgi:CRISPR-associated protein (TIGR02584 family)
MHHLNKRHILFSVAGETPAVVTETLFGLLERGVTAGEIHILTTAIGRRKMHPLLEEDGQVAAFNRAYNTTWAIRYEWIEAITAHPRRGNRPDVLGKGAMPLDDLRTTAHNTAAADRIVQCLQEWTHRDEVILHASLAGGRKTLGLYLAQAMSGFARPGDDLSHVLVSRECEQDQRFFFPLPDRPGHERVVDFSLIPFVRMRGLLPPLFTADDFSYSERVTLSEQYLQDRLRQSSDPQQPALLPLVVALDESPRILRLDGLKVAEFSPLGAGLYLFLFRYANLTRGQRPFRFREAFAYRHKLAECLEATAEGLRDGTPQKGLSSLGRAEEIEMWPEHWCRLGGQEAAERRINDLNQGFTRLNKDLRNLWDRASFGVFADSGRQSGEGASRWVNITEAKRLGAAGLWMG